MIRYIYEYPEQYAQDIISSFYLTPPIDLDKICEKLDIKVNYEYLGEIEAILIVSSSKKNIIINDCKSKYKRRERFTIAHEIGHYVIPWHENLQECDKIVDFKSEDIIEQQANAFASELLVPKDILLNDISDKKVTLSLIKELAEKYSVSLIVMARRILEYTDNEAIALIYYENGNKYIQMKSKSFNKEIKDGPITKSSAHKLLTCYNTSAEIKDIVEGKIWINGVDINFKVIEESMFQSSLNRVFTLLRVADEEDILDLEWDF